MRDKKNQNGRWKAPRRQNTGTAGKIPPSAQGVLMGESAHFCFSLEQKMYNAKVKGTLNYNGDYTKIV